MEWGRCFNNDRIELSLIGFIESRFVYNKYKELIRTESYIDDKTKLSTSRRSLLREQQHYNAHEIITHHHLKWNLGGNYRKLTPSATWSLRLLYLSKEIRGCSSRVSVSLFLYRILIYVRTSGPHRNQLLLQGISLVSVT